jgi:hypothetical protein
MISRSLENNYSVSGLDFATNGVVSGRVRGQTSRRDNVERLLKGQHDATDREQ